MGTIHERLNALERRFERSRRANRILVLAVFATACLAGAQGSSPTASKSGGPKGAPPSRDESRAGRPAEDTRRAIETHKLVLVDELGRPRATMKATGAGTTLTMLDEAGHKRLELSQVGAASGLRFFNSDESPVLSLQLPSDVEPACLEIVSTEGMARIKADGLHISDAAEHGRVYLSLLNGNFPVLGLSSAGQNGPPSVELAAPEGSRSLKLHDETGHPTFSLFAAEDGRTFLGMSHPSHERSLQIKSGPATVDGPAIEFFAPANDDGTGRLLPHLRLGLDNDRRPYIRIDDRDARPVFTAP